jgi:hypothetical protein
MGMRISRSTLLTILHLDTLSLRRSQTRPEGIYPAPGAGVPSNRHSDAIIRVARGLCRSPYRLPRRPNPAFHRSLAICPPQLGAPLGFRTIQVYPKDLPVPSGASWACGKLAQRVPGRSPYWRASIRRRQKSLGPPWRATLQIFPRAKRKLRESSSARQSRQKF